MFVEVASLVPSVTKTIRKDSPGVSPAGVLMLISATARPPPPNTSQSTAGINAIRLVNVGVIIVGLLCWTVTGQASGDTRPNSAVVRPGVPGTSGNGPVGRGSSPYPRTAREHLRTIAGPTGSRNRSRGAVN